MTRIEDYMTGLFGSGIQSDKGFLGAYNMGVWGVSVSGKPPLEQGLLVSGKVLTTKPKFTQVGPQNPTARNFVRFYDTPSLWGYKDKNMGLGPMLFQAIDDASATLGISLEGGVTDSEATRIDKYLKAHWGMRWDGNFGKLWSEVATREQIQEKMNKRGAWSELVARWKAVIAQSRYLVDITSLSPPVTGSEVQKAACQGIFECVNQWLIRYRTDPGKTPRLMIRILFGMTASHMYGTGNNTYWNEFSTRLVEALRPISPQIVALGTLRVPVILYGSDMGKKISTFNHSKIVAGDGQYAIVGGHNMCEEVSSNRAPVIHDMTAEVTGPGALSANAFAGSLWMKAAESGRLYIHRYRFSKCAFEDLSSVATSTWAPNNKWYYELGDQKEVPKVLTNQEWYYPMQDLPPTAEEPPPEGSVPATAIMGIGRWGDTKVFGVDCSAGLQVGEEISALEACQYASDVLKRRLIRDPDNTLIAMSQQDLVNAGTFGSMQASGHTICQVLGERLRTTPQGTAIRIVVSSRFTQNSEGLAYSYGDGPREAAERISDSLKGIPQASSNRKALPPRLAALALTNQAGSAEVHTIRYSTEPSFCTVAPLAFCQARGVTRDRGSYVWPDAKYKMERTYTNGRFWNKLDKAELKFGPGNHSKVMMVGDGDDPSTALVMIGSDNMYPSPLSEFNFVIEGAEAITQFRRQYWDPLWRYSARLGFTVHNNGNVT